MSPEALAQFLSGKNAVIALDGTTLAKLPDQALSGERLVLHSRLGELASKSGALDELSLTFDMPRWFGHNWDALEDCLTDLEWLPEQAIFLVLEGSLADPDDASTLVAILEDACAYWQDAARRFHVAIDTRLSAASE